MLGGNYIGYIGYGNLCVSMGVYGCLRKSMDKN